VFSASRLPAQPLPSSAATSPERFHDAFPLQLAENLADPAIADTGRVLTDRRDRELVGQQRVDERNDQRPLRAPATERSRTVLEVLVGGEEDTEEVPGPRRKIVLGLVPSVGGQAQRFVVGVPARVDLLLIR